VVAPSGELPGFLGSLAPLLDRYGYLAVAGLIGVESFGVPAPGQTIMVAAAVYAGAGRLNVVGVAAVAFLAAVCGDTIGYAIGRTGGRSAVHRFGRYVFLTPPRVERAERFFTRLGPEIVIAARFIDGLRQFNGVIAGIIAMRALRFVLYNAIGAVLWVGLWVSVGYLAGNHIVAIYHTVERFSWYALAVAVALVIGYVVLHVARRRRKADSA
jgi:membrane protein DedA with SNARE-associated domain